MDSRSSPAPLLVRRAVEAVVNSGVGQSITSTVLFHVSEEAGIRRFEPRPTKAFPHPVVWAIDALHLRNYLLPRNCPRVTYYRVETSTDGDAARFLGSSEAVVAIEVGWLERVQSAQLYCYRMPAPPFECSDAGAGYFVVSRVAVEPLGVDVIRDPIKAIEERGVEIRVLPNLWTLHDSVAASSLQFSMIRMRNAQKRPAA